MPTTVPAGAGGINTVWLDELDDAAQSQVRELLLAAREVDGRPERTEFGGGLHLLASTGGKLVGYAHLDTAGDAFGRQVAELIVHPGHRLRGIGTAMVQALVEKVPEKLRVWAHGDHPAAARIAERTGFIRARELLVLHVEVAADGWPEPRLPEGVSLRTFVPGQDERAVIDVNARAFDWHPEQSGLTVEDLRATEAEDWFDPEGFFLAEDDEGRLLGFHWTKGHPSNPRLFGRAPFGEVYVVGVDPRAQRGGLGRALTLAGLRYLHNNGLRQVILYVEGDNAPALAVYTRLGFARHEVDVQYAK